MTRFGYVMLTYFAMLAIGGLAFFRPAPRLIWNATASTPTGLYALRPAGQFRVLELVAVRPPEPIASYLADGGFLPRGVPLLKHVMALPGQTVCRASDAITVDHIGVGTAREPIDPPTVVAVRDVSAIAPQSGGLFVAISAAGPKP